MKGRFPLVNMSIPRLRLSTPSFYLHPSLFVKIFVALYSEVKFRFTFIVRIDIQLDVIVMAPRVDSMYIGPNMSGVGSEKCLGVRKKTLLLGASMNCLIHWRIVDRIAAWLCCKIIFSN